MKNLYLIVAYVQGTRAIGLSNKPLWKNLKADMQNFVQLTRGHIIIVGSVTFKTFGKPLQNRLNIIVTRDRSYVPPGVTDENRHLVYVCHSLEEAVGYAQMVADGRKVYIAGGEQIYTEVLYTPSLRPFEIIATEVDAGDLDGDKYFPPLQPEWQVVNIAPYEKDENNDYDFAIKRLRWVAA
jgi:dihydrofolate reductase